MQPQWPLIIFTALIAWSMGIFATQAVLSLLGKGKKIQMPSLLCSFVVMVIGGVAVFFHLQHWERIFNGFGHITSGITQELIALVVVFVFMVVYFIMLRRSEDGFIAKWLSVAVIVVAATTDVVVAHSYMMPSRPAWDTFAWILAVVGNSCAAGPLAIAIISALKSDNSASLGLISVVGTGVNVATTVVYGLSLNGAIAQFDSLDYYFDPTVPTQKMVDVAATSASQSGLLWAGAVLVGAVLPLVMAVLARKTKGTPSVIVSTISLVAVLAGAVILRVVFYNMGFTVLTAF